MRTDDLIAALASRAAPVRPLPSPGVRLAAWSALAMTCVGAGLAVFGVRPGAGALLTTPQFMQTALVAAGTIVLAAGGALVLAIPGAERSPALRGAAIALIGLWAGLLIWAVSGASDGYAPGSDRHWPVCVIRVIVIGFVPSVALFGMLRRGAPLRLGWSGGLAAIAAIATGALAIQFICPISEPGHALLGHFGPVLLMGAIGAACGRALLAGDSRTFLPRD